MLRRIILGCLLCMMMFGFSFGTILDELPEPYDPNDVPFPYDPNQVKYKLLGTVQLYVGGGYVLDVDYYDAERHGITTKLLSCESFCDVNNGDFDWQLIIEPNEPGLFYIDLRITDKPNLGPPDYYDSAKTDHGTILLKVHRKVNQQPIFGCFGNIITDP